MNKLITFEEVQQAKELIRQYNKQHREQINVLFTTAKEKREYKQVQREIQNQQSATEKEKRQMEVAERKQAEAYRQQQMAIKYFENYNLTEVGEIFGITRERVRQIINLLGYTPRPSTPIIKETLTKDRPHSQTTRERFWSQVKIKSEDECWEWQGGRHKKSTYGSMCCSSLKERYTHRIAYILHYMKRPKNCVLHSCDNPPCCNPKHLRDGTQAENVQDRQTRRYDFWYQRLKEGQRNNKKPGKAFRKKPQREGKYSDEVVAEAFQLDAMGITKSHIAKKVGIPIGTIYSILAGRIEAYKKFLPEDKSL